MARRVVNLEKLAGPADPRWGAAVARVLEAMDRPTASARAALARGIPGPVEMRAPALQWAMTRRG